MKPLSFCILFSFFLVFFFSIGIEKTFLLLLSLERKIDHLSVFVEFRLAVLKIELDSFFSMPSICSFFSPSLGLGPDWL